MISAKGLAIALIIAIIVASMPLWLDVLPNPWVAGYTSGYHKHELENTRKHEEPHSTWSSVTVGEIACATGIIEHVDTDAKTVTIDGKILEVCGRWKTSEGGKGARAVLYILKEYSGHEAEYCYIPSSNQLTKIKVDGFIAEVFPEYTHTTTSS